MAEKGWSIPELRGKKQDWFSLVKGLVELVSEDQANNLDMTPQIQGISNPYPWRSYAPFLKYLGLVSNRAGMLHLTETGIEFNSKPTKDFLANIIQDKTRLFAEVLGILDSNPRTVEEVDKELCESYCLNWVNLSNTRRRMDWLEVLDLIQCIGGRKWAVTDAGYKLLGNWCLVNSKVLELATAQTSDIIIAEPPSEIAELLEQLRKTPELHKKRCTYNIIVPSPNRIDNLRVIVQYASERVSKVDLYQFIENEYNLKVSSVDGMMPFLKACGLLEEVGRGIYISTPVAKAWCSTGSDLDFIRIFHANMRFVGEMIKAAEEDIVRNDLYVQSKRYGLNASKARTISAFLIEAGLLEEPQYLHLHATALGKCFVSQLPLEEEPDVEKENSETSDRNPNENDSTIGEMEQVFNRLSLAARDPMAEGKASGVAFEEAIAGIFSFMGFEAKRIGGAGDTDVIVRWKDIKGKNVIAIVDGKSKSGGQVSHSDISDVAIDTHKEKNSADFVAIVGPGFSGDTIRNHARKKGFALITDAELIEIARTARILGLDLCEIALIFQTPDGLTRLDELMASKQRELDIISIVISKFCREQELLGSLSPRDVFLLLRNTNISPSLDELCVVFDMLSKDEIGVLHPVNSTRAAENTTYMLHEGKGTANRLRALASAIEKGLCE